MLFFNEPLELGSLLPVVSELNRRAWTLKRWITRDGKIAGGRAFTRARLHQLLTNAIYTGQVRHRGELYPGEHEAIVDATTLEKVQIRLRANGPGGGRSLRNKYGALLKGVVRCATCNVGMVHTYTQKETRLYRYYVCVKAHQQGWNLCATRSVSAPELEQAVVEQVRSVGRNPITVTGVLGQMEAPGCRGITRDQLVEALRDLGSEWPALAPREQEQMLRMLVETVSYDGRTGTVTVGFRSTGWAELCQWRKERG